MQQFKQNTGHFSRLEYLVKYPTTSHAFGVSTIHTDLLAAKLKELWLKDSRGLHQGLTKVRLKLDKNDPPIDVL